MLMSLVRVRQGFGALAKPLMSGRGGPCWAGCRVSCLTHCFCADVGQRKGHSKKPGPQSQSPKQPQQTELAFLSGLWAGHFVGPALVLLNPGYTFSSSGGFWKTSRCLRLTLDLNQDLRCGPGHDCFFIFYYYCLQISVALTIDSYLQIVENQ